MDPPHLDLKQSAVNDIDFADPDEEHNYLQIEQRNYIKKHPKAVTDPDTIVALKYMVENVRTYTRVPFNGVDINGARYAFYFGTTNKKNTIGLSTNIVLSSEKKVFNVSNVDAPAEMKWNPDVTHRGTKRGYGHIYLGALTGGRALETNILNVFQLELGIIL